MSRGPFDSRFDSRILAAVILVLVAAALRLVPHPPNFSPIAAMALFGAAVLDRKMFALVLPLAAMLLSDLVIGFHDQTAAVYGSILLIQLLGFVTLREKRGFVRVGLTAVAGSAIFFVVTNMSVWAFSGMYSKDATGLAACFTAALPFFQNSLAGDLFFSGVLFGAYALVERSLAKRSAIA